MTEAHGCGKHIILQFFQDLPEGPSLRGDRDLFQITDLFLTDFCVRSDIPQAFDLFRVPVQTVFRLPKLLLTGLPHFLFKSFSIQHTIIPSSVYKKLLLTSIAEDQLYLKMENTPEAATMM